MIQHEHNRKVMSRGPKFRELYRINWNYNFKIIMDSIEDSARAWAKRKDNAKLDTLSEWVKAIRSLVQRRILEKLC